MQDQLPRQANCFRKFGGLVPEWEIAWYVSAADTLSFVHEKDIVHRDLKPSNILLDTDGNPYVADFGLALAEEKRWDHAGEFAGSPAYMSPEQVQGNAQQLNGLADIWALGVILYELLTGTRPFSGDTRSQLTAEIMHHDPKPPSMRRRGGPVSAELIEICRKCLEKAPRDRFQSTLELAAALRQEQIGPNPYQGLAAFDEEHAELFFGREEQVERLWQKFSELSAPPKEGQGKYRLLSILGPSGCGKSSLAKAGLLPRIRREFGAAGKHLVVAKITPDDDPLGSLALQLARQLTNDATPVLKAREFQTVLEQPGRNGEHDGLISIARMLDGDSELLVFVDQFEELYSVCTDEASREAFIECLLFAAHHWPVRVSVVLTLRSDFLGQTQDHQKLNELIAEQGIIVPAMNELELTTAIAKPAEISGYPLDPIVVDQLVKDTKGREGALPLLQIALTGIWEGLKAGILPGETLRAIGGVGGALAGEAERVYGQLDDSEKRIARRAFLAMVQLGEGTRDTRRRAPIESMVSVDDTFTSVRTALDEFGSTTSRLVTLSADQDGAEYAEVTHEALFDEWRRLSQWIDESRVHIKLERRASVEAQNWSLKGRPADLLWRGSNLDQLQEYNRIVNSDLPRILLEFLSESRKRQYAERNRRGLLFVLLSSTTVLSAILAGASLLSATRARDFSRQAIENESRALLAEEQSKAEAAKATENLKDALGVVDDYLTEVSESFELLRGAPGTQELRKRLLEKADDYYRGFLTANQTVARDSPDIGEKIAFVNLRLGNIQKETGEKEKAEESYLRGLQLLAELVREHPSVAKYRNEMSKHESNLGGIYLERGDVQAAITRYESAAETAEQLVLENPADPDFRNSLGTVFTNLSICYGENPKALPRALGFAQRGLRVYKELARDHPNTGYYKERLAGGYAAVAASYNSIQNTKESVAYFKKAIEVGERHARENAEFHGLWHQLAGYCNGLAKVYLNNGRNVDAIKELERSIQFSERVVTDNPTVMVYAERLVSTCTAVAWVLSTSTDSSVHDGRLALKYAERACALTDWSDYICLDTLAAAYAESGNFEKAKQYQQKAFDLSPDSTRGELRERFELYESRRPYRE